MSQARSRSNMDAGRPRSGAQGHWGGAAGPTSACSIAGAVARGMGPLGGWTHVWAERGGSGIHPPALGIMGAQCSVLPSCSPCLCSPCLPRDRPPPHLRRSLRAARGSWLLRCLPTNPLAPPRHERGASQAARRRPGDGQAGGGGAAAARTTTRSRQPRQQGAHQGGAGASGRPGWRVVACLLRSGRSPSQLPAPTSMLPPLLHPGGVRAAAQG